MYAVITLLHAQVVRESFSTYAASSNYTRQTHSAPWQESEGGDANGLKASTL